MHTMPTQGLHFYHQAPITSLHLNGVTYTIRCHLKLSSDLFFTFDRGKENLFFNDPEKPILPFYQPNGLPHIHSKNSTIDRSREEHGLLLISS